MQELEELEERPARVGTRVAVPAASRFTTLVETRLEDLRRYAGQLEALAASAAEVNVFYEPWMLFPALKNYAAQAKLVFLLVFVQSSAAKDDAATLCGFFPMVDRKRFRGLPLRHLVLWR